MLRQFVAAEFKHGIGDNYYPDQVKTLTEIVDKWIKDGDYTTIPESIKEYFGTWVGEGYIRNTEHIAWKRLLSNNASAKWGENNAKQQEYAINLRNRLWTLCKLVEQAAKSKHHPLDPKNIDGYSQIMNSLEIFDKVHKELWPDHDLIPPPKLDGEQYTIDMGVDEPLSARARVAAIEERVSSQHNGQRRPSLHRRHFRRRSVVKTYKLVKLKKQIRTFIKEFKKLLNHPLAPAESIFMPAEPQIKGSEPGSKKNPFKNKKNALAECRKQIQDEGNSELNGDEAVINFGFVYVKLIKYWIIYINNYRTSPAPTATKLGNMNNKELREKAGELGLYKEEVKRLANGANLSNNSTWMTGIKAYLAHTLKNLPFDLQSGFNILTYKEVNEYCHPFGARGSVSGNSPEATSGQFIWDELIKLGLVENPPESEFFGPTFDDEPTTPIRKPRQEYKKPRQEYKELKKKYRELLQELLKMIEADAWKQYSDKQGRIYHYNFITKESQWDDQRIDN